MSEVPLSPNNLLATPLTRETVFRVSLDVSLERSQRESFATDSADASLMSPEMFQILSVSRKLFATGLTLQKSSMAATPLVFPQLALSMKSLITNFAKHSPLSLVRCPHVNHPTV